MTKNVYEEEEFQRMLIIIISIEKKLSIFSMSKRKRKRSASSPARPRDPEEYFQQWKMERRSHVQAVLEACSFFFIAIGLGAKFYDFLLRKWEKSEWQRLFAENKTL